MVGILAVSWVPVSPSAAQPTLDEVRDRVEQLTHQAEVAAERYNDAQEQRADLLRDLKALQADTDAQSAKVTALEDAVGESIAAQYEGRLMPSASDVVASDDPSQYLEQLTVVDAYNSVQLEAMGDYFRSREALRIRRDALAARNVELQKVEAGLAADKREADTKFKDAKKILDDMEAEERQRLLAASIGTYDGPIPKASGTGKARIAVQFALDQLGDAYVWAAVGPDAWDCSGLMMGAWGAAGVSLPHSSRVQSTMGTPVEPQDLQPGDLVFYFSPVSHVAMYIGNGLVVHAANPSVGVKISRVTAMPYTNAVRVG